MSFVRSVCAPVWPLLSALLLLVGCGVQDPAAPVTGEAGLLQIATEPGGAELYINGEHYGRTPEQPGERLSIRLPAGTYTVEATRALDPFSDLFAAAQIVHIEDKPTPVVTIRLVRRDTEAGRQRAELEEERVGLYREAQIQRFMPRDDGTVLEVATGLLWTRCAVGQVWTGSTCTGSARQINWDQAFKVANEFSFAGSSDWRLPTQPELFALTFCSTGMRSETNAEGLGGGCAGDYTHPTILESVFPNTPAANFWTSTPHARFNFSAWGVSFQSGHTGTGGRSDYVHVRLVREVE